MQQMSPIHWFILEIQKIFEYRDLNDHAHSLSPSSKNHESNFWLSWIFINTPKTSIFYKFLFEIQPILVSLDQGCHTHFSPCPLEYFQPTSFFFIKIFHQAFSSLCSGDLVNLKILQSEWPRAFWLISQEQDFS